MDFALILFIALVVTGAVVLYDRVVRRKALKQNNQEKREPRLIEYSKAFFPVILLVFLLRSFIVEPFRIPSGSMLPSLHIGDFILVNKFGYGIRLPIVNKKVVDVGQPKRGDVMVFRFPNDPTINYIKRVIGLPGDVIRYYNKKLYINDREMDQKTVDDYVIVNETRRNAKTKKLIENLDGVEHDIWIDSNGRAVNNTWTVPVGHFFVMGDNRDQSNDSRVWGFVPEANVIGKAFFIWLSWDLAHGKAPDFSRIGNSVR